MIKSEVTYTQDAKKGTGEINLWNPHRNQRKLINDPARFKVIVCGRRFGKALALNTPIMTVDGYRPLIDISVGDIVFDERGEQTTVLYKSGVYKNRKCFLVEFSDGESIVADADHDWMVETAKIRKNNNRNKNPKYTPIKKTTNELSKDFILGDGVGNNYSIQGVFHLKAANRNTLGVKNKRRYITNVVEVPSVPVQCLMVDSPSHLFLAGKKLVPTHNTTYAVNTLVKKALLKDGGVFWYVAPTYRQAKMIAWQMVANIVAGLPDGLVTKVNESELYVVIGNNSRIDVKGSDNPDSLRGVGLDGIILDEYADMRPNVFQEIIRPALTDKKGWAYFIGTPRGFNHFYSLYMDAGKRKDAGEPWSRYKFTSYDNPLLEEEEINEAKKNISEDRFAQEYLADFRKHEGLVYKEFSQEKHVFYDLPERGFVEKIGGIDFGFTNPYCALVIAKDFDNNYWVLHEEYQQGKTQGEITEKIKNLTSDFQVNQWYPDPAEPDRIEEMSRAGLNMREVNKDISAGVDRVRNLLKGNRIKIHNDCKNLIRELEVYRYPDEDSIRAKINRGKPETPIKENDHACISGDSLINTVNGDIPIKDLVGRGGYVYSFSHSENRIVVKKFKNVCKTGKKKTLKITLDDGSEIIATKDHPFLLRGGDYVEAQELMENDSLMPLYQTAGFCHPNCKQKAIRLRKKGWRNHKIIKIEEHKETDVYNMYVQDTNNFACEGVIVHNCDALRYALFTNEPSEIQDGEDFGMYTQEYN